MKFDHADPSLDELLGVLANHRRRMVLRFLATQSNNVASVDELVRYLETQERTTEKEHAMTPEELEVELQHRHLPRLEERDLIEYDIRSGRIEYAPDERAETLLQFVRDL